MELINLQQKIGLWHRETFGDHSDIPSLIMEKISEETEELSEAHIQPNDGRARGGVYRVVAVSSARNSFQNTERV